MRNADERFDIETWAFLGTGWWASHLAAIAAVGYIGYYLRRRIRG